MERLTKRINGKAAFYECNSTCGTCEGVLCGSVFLMADRLAAYEDTGLDPERVAELAQAEKDGRLVVLPCKVGDTVWTNIAIVGDRYKSADRPYPVEVVFIGMGEDKRFFHVQYSNGRVFPFDFDKIGKTVFLTREEAEAALKKGKADNETD